MAAVWKKTSLHQKVKYLAIFKENICKHIHIWKLGRNLYQMKKKLNRYLYLGRKYNKFRFGEKRRKIENMASLPAFFINMP